MRRVIVNQLRQLGAEKILTAVDGKAALRILTSQHVDMVLSDWNMPVMSGLELLKTMREDSKLFTLPFIMITAEAERTHIEEAIACGVTSMILKPYSPSQLMVRVEKALAWKPGRAPGAKAATTAPKRLDKKPDDQSVAPQKPTILIVDDTTDNLVLLSGLLKTEYRVRLAQNGAKTVEICTSDDPPDLVLLDIMMPGMDGFEVAKHLREHPTSENIPVIFVTAMTSSDARLKGLDLGAVDFITKPVDPDALKHRVRNFMRYVQLRKNLQAEYDGMVEMAQLKEDVAHITRHDMKGPLAGVLGLLHALIEDDSVGRKQLEQLKLVEETALQVLNMINLSGELFKIETGRFELHAVPVPIADILRRIAEINRTAYAGKDIHISVDTDVPVGDEVPQSLGDAMLCYSLLPNILKSACEAAPDSSKITVKLYDQSPLRIVIENQGAVPADIRSRFFEKYSTSGKSGGTGFGNYSAKLLTEAQNGTITLAVSDENNTTAITLTLPRASSAV
ncbi:hybrid sensor histidine kinase/response regulator [Undibacterium parvum]|uniref:histidine kinase n=3 Tax=Undibacterium TaxID=401469 RepID=A0A6M4ADS4_9BURK|nr:hybrid sensor histidine kinase/response regulator [Undibacterium parvum]QJQ07729.1 response regulator [Undibacterium piscinae]